MGQLIHENTSRRPLIRYTLHRPIVTEQLLSGMTSSLIPRADFAPPPTLTVGQ